MRTLAFVKFAWFVLGYNLLVIVWGAAVRATGSGAGCGDHWPLCNGAILPRAPAVETLIEFTHRLTSGLALLLVVGLFVWARRLFPEGAPARSAARASLVFIVIEALIGAGLVLFELVAHDASLKRALSMSLHLVNTFLLVGALTLTAWWASGRPAFRMRGHGRRGWPFLAAFAGFLLVGMTGAIAALGDTLFPRTTLGFSGYLDAAHHLLLRLRILHPFVAVAVGLGVMALAWVHGAKSDDKETRAWTTILFTLVFAQLVLGAFNIVLMAPVWMQLTHLLLANLVWIAQVIVAACVLGAEAGRSKAAAAAHGAGAHALGLSDSR